MSFGFFLFLLFISSAGVERTEAGLSRWERSSSAVSASAEYWRSQSAWGANLGGTKVSQKVLNEWGYTKGWERKYRFQPGKATLEKCQVKTRIERKESE